MSTRLLALAAASLSAANILITVLSDAQTVDPFVHDALVRIEARQTGICR